MDTLTEPEVLGLLGYIDLPHSFEWYRQHFPALRADVCAFVADALRVHGFFPSTIPQLAELDLRLSYRQIAFTRGGTFVVHSHNTDRGSLLEEHVFGTAAEAAQHLIAHSGSAAGRL